MERRIHFSTSLLLAVKAQPKSGKTFVPAVPGIPVKPLALQLKQTRQPKPATATECMTA
jgi:hypothetical protein